MWAGDAGRDAHDPRLLVGEAQRRAGLRLAFDCGLDDGMLEDNRTFHAHLSALGVPHGYAEHPGGHDWDYWRTHFADHFRFHLANEGPLTT